MRVLHLIESIDGPPCDTALALLRDLVRATPNVEHRVAAIGPANLRHRLESIGLPPAQHAPVPHGQGWLAAPRLRGRIRREGPHDLLHAWSPRGAMLAGLIARCTRGAGKPLATLSHPWPHPLSPPLRWLLRRQPCPVLTLSPEAEPDLRAAGLDAAPLHPVEPAVDPARLETPDRTALRQSWGVPNEQTRVIAALADPPEAVDALTALLSVGMVRETGRAVRLLISPRATGLRRAERICHDAGRNELLAISSMAEQPWRCLSAVDLVLAMNAGLSTAWSMAAARPVVAPNTPGLGNQLTDKQTALLGPPRKAGENARRLIQLIEQPDEAHRLADHARREADRRHSPGCHAERVQAVYRAIHENRLLPDSMHPGSSHASPDRTSTDRDHEEAGNNNTPRDRERSAATNNPRP